MFTSCALDRRIKGKPFQGFFPISTLTENPTVKRNVELFQTLPGLLIEHWLRVHRLATASDGEPGLKYG